MKQQRWSLPPNKGDNMPDRAELTDQSTKACHDTGDCQAGGCQGRQPGVLPADWCVLLQVRRPKHSQHA